MNIKISSVIISKAVWMRIGLALLVTSLPITLGLPFLYFPAVSFPVILLTSRATKQFRIDNGYEDGADTPMD